MLFFVLPAAFRSSQRRCPFAFRLESYNASRYAPVILPGPAGCHGRHPARRGGTLGRARPGADHRRGADRTDGRHPAPARNTGRQQPGGHATRRPRPGGQQPGRAGLPARCVRTIGRQRRDQVVDPRLRPQSCPGGTWLWHLHDVRRAAIDRPGGTPTSCSNPCG